VKRRKYANKLAVGGNCPKMVIQILSFSAKAELRV
jgi:hypothetical protein